MNMWLYLFLLGRIALLNAVVLGLPLCCALYWGEDTVQAFAIPMAVTLVLGLLLQNAGKQHKKQLGVAEGAWYLVSVWLLLGLIGMMPYVLTGILTPADAFFESISAYTTTGVSCLAPGQAEASSLLFWHSLMEWMGGLNFIIMLVTVVPQVSGCFGVTLSAHQSIAFSPMVSRMHNAALQTGKIYVGITLISAALYIAAGLNVFEAVNQAMTTASTSGGTASLDFAGYDNLFLELAAMISMILASCNFLLIWRAVSRRELRSIFSDTELRTFLAILGAVSVMIVFHLWHSGVYDIWQSLRYGTFAVVSFLSTTGFASAQLSLWPGFDRYVLFLLVFAGGCIGSATGGLRIMRIIVLFRMAAREMRRTLHPQMVVSLKIDGVPVSMKIISRVLSFFFLYIGVFFFSMLVISLSGIPLLQAMGVAAGCLSSVGSTAELYGLTSYAALPVWTKLYCTFVMILGRIEIFSFLIVLQTIAARFHSKW